MSNLSMTACPFWNDNNKLTTRRRHIFSPFGHKAVWEGLCPSSRVPYRNKKLHFTDSFLSVLHALLVKVLFHILYTSFTLIQEGDAIIYRVLRSESRECWVLHRINFVTDTIVTDESNYILNTPLLILKGTYP